MDQCIPAKGFRNEHGYGRVRYQGKQHYAHRVAYAKANGLNMVDLAGVVIRHKCDNPECVNPDHLEQGTPADNVRDKVERNRHRYGDTHPSTVLTDEECVEIRRRYTPRCKVNGATAMAREYGVSMQRIFQVARGERCCLK